MIHVGDAELYTGDVLAVLAGLPEESVHCVVTSPPYWGLRRYGNYEMQTLFGSPDDFAKSKKHPERWWILIRWRADERGGVFSRDKKSWIGAHGLEPTPELYVQHEVQIFRAVHRVLRKDGTLWLNLGDSYAAGGPGKQHTNVGSENVPTRSAPPGLKPKDLVGIPWRVAFALQADGWYLRSDIIWSKPNPMPESVTDRPTKAHEYLFLLSKSPRYFYDAEAIKEQSIHAGETRVTTPKGFAGQAAGLGVKPSGNAKVGSIVEIAAGRNRRTVWTIATEPYPGAHFATFPRKLVQPCILAGCPEHACPKCGAPWVREVERGFTAHDGATESKYEKGSSAHRMSILRQAARERGGEYQNGTRVIGEHPTCSCGLPSIGGTVLDPFGGSGTTAEVALEYGRRVTLIELKPEYMELQKRRLASVAGRPMLDFVGGTS